MANVMRLREWRFEGDRFVFIKAGKRAGCFGFLDCLDEHGKPALEIFAIGGGADSIETSKPFRDFIESMSDDAIQKALYKKCRGCMNVFHTDNIEPGYGVCDKCSKKVARFKKVLNVSDTGDCIVGGFGSGRFLSSYEFDDRLEIGSFKCSLVRVLANPDGDYTLKSLFSNKPRVGKIERNGHNMFTAVCDKKGYPPLPDGLILLYYDIFLNTINGEVDALEHEAI